MVEPDLRCTDIRDTCIAGDALRRSIPLSTALAEVLDSLLYRGVRPTQQPLSRVEAIEKIVALHCGAHRPLAEMILAGLSPGLGIARNRRTPPPRSLQT